MGTYRTAQICLNGHIITDSVDTCPELKSDYCSQCGSKTIMECPNCSENIRGYFHVENVIDLTGNKTLPFYCHNCGSAYPWTETKLQAAKDLTDEVDELDFGDREKLKGTFSEIIKDGPQTEVAAFRFKKILEKVKGKGASLLWDLIVDIASETAKKIIRGS